jgi:hypothetical protein
MFAQLGQQQMKLVSEIQTSTHECVMSCRFDIPRQVFANKICMRSDLHPECLIAFHICDFQNFDQAQKYPHSKTG